MMTTLIQKYVRLMVWKKLLRLDGDRYVDSYEVTRMLKKGMSRDEIYLKLTGKLVRNTRKKVER